ncbi:MAG: heavy metal translocating P-type ATPase [Candidatus Enteromonas sp.]|nr:heavy metal translocating P-type ATPase [Candidatus Enteromonas sp.]
MAHEHEKEHSHLVFFIRVALSLTLAILGQFVWNEANVNWWINLLVMLVAFFIVSYDVIWEMIEGIIHERAFFTEETLMVLAAAGAFSLRAFGPEHNEYFEAVLVMLLFQVGEFFQHIAEEKSKKSLTAALDIRKEFANVLRDGKVNQLRPEELQKGDHVLLKAGERCLCDGIVASGAGAMNESSLTGESMPVEKALGDSVFGGTILQSGGMEIVVEKEYSDSTIAKLFHLIEHANEHKAKTARSIDRFAKIYTPVVFALAILVAVLPPLIIAPTNSAIWSDYLYASLSFLVVSCPCAVVLSVPLAYFSGLGLASKNGILVKGAENFDAISRVKAIAFDKTGTLTKGEFSISKKQPLNCNEETLLNGLCIAESRSNHPIAKALSKSISHPIKSDDISDYEEIPGNGTRVTYQSHVYQASRNPKNPENKASSTESGTIVYLIVDGEDKGFVALEDTPKANSETTILRLKDKGIETIMISGDKTNVAERICDQLHIDVCCAELTPEEKSKTLIEQKEKYGSIAYVGDGINDAPTLALADVGIAMGGLGSDLAVNQADVVLLDDDPLGVDRFLRIGKMTERRAVACIVFALAAKGIIMALSLVGASTNLFTLPLWVSVFGDSGVAILDVLFALTLFFRKVRK